MLRWALAGSFAGLLYVSVLIVVASGFSRGGWYTGGPGGGRLLVGAWSGMGRLWDWVGRPADGGTASPAVPGIAPSRPPVQDGIWISRAALRALPTAGPAWDALRAAAEREPGVPTLCDQDSNDNVRTLAKALVYARTGEERYRVEVRRNVLGAIGTEAGEDCRSLALGRELAAYVIAADLVGLAPDEDARFREWLAAVRTRILADGRSLTTCHELRPNNWGTMCGASRAAASAYLGDRQDLGRVAAVFDGFLGDRSAYAGFEYGDPAWQADPSRPVGINPAGATRQGVRIDGALPDDMRRAGGFTPGCPERFGYPWEALQGAVVQAEILQRQGFDAWAWQDQALRRALAFLVDLSQRCPAAIDEATSGDDRFTPWIVNRAYGADFPAVSPAGHGKIAGWTDWTHDRRTRDRN